MSTRQNFTLGLLGLMLLGGTLQAQIVFNGTEDLSGSIYNGVAPIAGLDGGYLWVQGNFGERPGNPGNYFSTGGVAPIQPFGPNQALVVDGQVWVTDGRNVGGNIGLNQRWYLPEYDSIIGLNSFFTLDHTQNDNFMRQFSFGAELVTPIVRFDGNFYLPVGDDPQTYGPPIMTTNCMQQGHGFVFIDMLRAEQQMIGGDVEAGFSIPGLEWISLYGGAYWWDADLGESIRGASGRLEFDLNSVLVGASVYNDNHFGTSVNANATLLIGAGPIAVTPRLKDTYSRMFDRTRRRTRIGVQETLVTVTEDAINPNTGLPYNVLVLDNTAAPGGDGTFENPFDNLSDASNMPADVIFIRRGTTTAASPLAGGAGLVVSHDNVFVIGEGTPVMLPAANRPGLFCELSAAGTGPFVTSDPNTSVITLAGDNITVVGVNIVSPANGRMISGNGINDYSLLDINQDFGGGTTGPGAGIVMTNTTGVGVIDNFYFNNPVKVAPGAVVIQNNSTLPLDFRLTNAQITGGQVGVDLRANNTDVNAFLEFVHNDMSGIGTNLSATNGGSLRVDFATSNSFREAMNHNMNIVAGNGGDVQVTGESMNLTLAMNDSIHTSQNNGSVSLSLRDSALGFPGDDVVEAVLTNGSVLDLNFDNNFGLNAGDDVFALSIDQASTVNANIVGGNFVNATGDGFDATVTNSSTFNLAVDGTPFTNAGGHGLSVVADSGSVFDGVLLNSSLASAGGNAAGVTLSNGSTGFLTLDSTDGDGAGGNGLFFNVATASNFTANLVNGVLLDAAGVSAINGNVSGFSMATINGNGVSGAGAMDDAIHLVVANNSNLIMDMQNSGTFAGAGGDGFSLMSTGTSTSNVVFQGGGVVDFSGAGGNGLISTAGTNSQSIVQFDDGANFDLATLDAIRLVSVTNSSTILDGTSISGANAGQDGIDLVAIDNSMTILGLTNPGSFTMAGGDALKFFGSGGSLVNAAIAAPNGMPALFDMAGDQGIDGVLQDSSAILTLANLNFSGAGVDGMAVRSNDSDFSAGLTNLQFDNAATGDAIRIQSHNGSGSSVVASGLSGSNAGDDAIRLEALGGSSNSLTMTDTGSFSTPTGDGLDYIASGNSLLNVDIDAGAGTGLFNNAVTGNGVVGTTTDSTTVLNLSGLDFSGAFGDGLAVRSDNATTTGTLTNLQFDNAATGDAMRIEAENNSTSNFTGTGLSGSNAGNDAIRLTSLGGSTSSLVMTNTGSFSTPTGDGVDFTATGTSTLSVDISAGAGAGLFNNAVNGNGVVGTTTDSMVNMVFNGLDFSGANLNGMSITGTNSTITGNTTQTTFDNAVAGDGIVWMLDSTTATYTFSAVNAGNNVGRGLAVNATNGSIVNLTTNGVNLDNSLGGDALQLIADGGTMLNVSGTSVSGINAGNDGIHIEANNLSSTSLVLNGSLRFNNATDDGISYSANNGNITLDLFGTVLGNFNDAGGHAVNGLLTNGSTATVDLTNLSAVNAALNGYQIVSTGSTFDARVNTVDFIRAPAGTTFNGLNAILDDNAFSQLDLINSRLTNMVNDGLHVEASNFTTFDVNDIGSLYFGGSSIFNISAVGGSVVFFP
ncbi:MAG: inverse autotransporter beta domain-containing protein [Planctomycetaceae bacterium]